MQREQLEVDVLFVGAGPACLSAAFHLSRLVRRHDREVEAGSRPGPPLGEQLLLVVEKGKEILDGAGIDLIAAGDLGDAAAKVVQAIERAG